MQPGEHWTTLDYAEPPGEQQRVAELLFGVDESVNPEPLPIQPPSTQGLQIEYTLAY
jgi:hypothetical protein